MKAIGIIFIILGIIGLIYGGITWTSKKDVVDAGPLDVEVTERQSIPLTPIVSGILLVSGIIMVSVDNRRTVVASGRRASDV